MGRPKGSLNKDKSHYVVRCTNIIDDSKCEKKFANITEIVTFLCEKGMEVSEKTIYRYISKGCPNYLQILKE